MSLLVLSELEKRNVVRTVGKEHRLGRSAMEAEHFLDPKDNLYVVNGSSSTVTALYECPYLKY